MALVAADKSYDVFLTSSPPNQLRFRIFNANASFKQKLYLYCLSANIIDLYKDDVFKAPTNSYYSDG